MITFVLIVDIIGITVGLYSIYAIQKSKRGALGGKVGSALGLFIWGVLFMIAAFGITILISRLHIISPFPLDVHHLLMTIGMIFFVISARKFTGMISA